VHQVANMSAGTFFGTLAAMMVTNRPLPADTAAVANLEAIGITAGDPFDISMLRRHKAAALERAARVGERIVSSDAALLREFGRPVNGWTWSTDLGQYGTEYLKRAIVANRALGANLGEDAVYFYAQQDGRGVPFNGKNQYTLTFPADDLPPVNSGGFWSVTMYNAAGALVGTPNNLGSTQITYDGLEPNVDGSYQFFIQANQPTDPADDDYWIKAPEGRFLLLLRTYWPLPMIYPDDTYKPPPVVRTGARPTPLTPTARLRLRTPFIPQRLGSLIVPN
jgi:hypothetical protein